MKRYLISDLGISFTAHLFTLGILLVSTQSQILPKKAPPLGDNFEVHFHSKSHFSAPGEIPKKKMVSISKNSADLPVRQSKQLEKQLQTLPHQNLPLAQNQEAGSLADNAKEFGSRQGMDTDHLDRYKAELVAFIQQQSAFHYPKAARALRQTGKVTVRVTIQTNGKFREILIHAPSQYEKLNHAALELFEKIGSFKPLPEELSHQQWTVEIPIRYELS